MGSRVTRIAKFTMIAMLGVAPASVFAGGGTGLVGFAPADALAVPALNGPMLAALGLLMAVFAVRVFRSSSSNLGRMSSLGLVAGGVFLMVVNGVESLQAIPTNVLEPDPSECGTGGEIRFTGFPGNIEFLNSCPNRLEIVRVDCDNDPVLPGGLQTLEQRAETIGSCVIGLLLDPDQRCSLPNNCGPI